MNKSVKTLFEEHSSKTLPKEDGSFHTRKSRNYNSLRGNLYYNSVTSKLIEEEIQCQNKVL